MKEEILSVFKKDNIGISYNIFTKLAKVNNFIGICKKSKTTYKKNRGSITHDIKDNDDNYIYEAEFDSLMMFHGWVKNRHVMIPIIAPTYNIHLKIYIIHIIIGTDTHKSLSTTFYIHVQNK